MFLAVLQLHRVHCRYDLETDQREEVNLADRCPNVSIFCADQPSIPSRCLSRCSVVVARSAGRFQVLATMRAVLKGYEASANILSPFSIPHDFKVIDSCCVMYSRFQMALSNLTLLCCYLLNRLPQMC